jgi:sterol desaturase/sphingolipid hydroxylase (fatty acid hydroxylase superfamily)
MLNWTRTMPQLFGPQTQTILLEISRLALRLAIVAAIFVPLERLFAAHPQKILRRGIFADLSYYVINSLVIAFLLSMPIGLIAWAAHALLPPSFLALTASMPLWARLVAGLVAGEIGYYWGHRLSHENPFLWDFHSIHHSAEEIDFLVNSRAHPVDLVFGRICALAPLYALGLGSTAGASGSLVPFLVTLMGLLWGFFIHANVKWRFGPLEWLVSTPAFHHWHHTRSGPINRNYSSTLPWLDRVFGTYYLPTDALPEAYGIQSKLPETVLGQLAHPFNPPIPDRAEASKSGVGSAT